jgi:AcrR family transcriptional regulator
VGRPRRGTETERNDALILAATKVFLRDGYGLASIDKVATEAGVSTRTIYERFKNKAELLGAVITRLVDRDLACLSATDELAALAPVDALTCMGQTITRRLCEPEAAALFRITAAEAQRFPEFVAKMRANAQLRFESAVAGYLRVQMARGTLVLDDAERAAVLFLQMVSAEARDCLLFGPADALSKIDLDAHVRRVVGIFLFGAVPRARNTGTVNP